MLTTVGKLAIANAGVSGLTIPRVGLFTNDFAPNALSVYADFTLPTYTGYANHTAVPSAVFIPQGGDPSTALGEAVFLGPTAGAGTDVFGWFLFDNVTHAVFAFSRFDESKSLQNLLDRLAVDIIVAVSGSESFDVEN